MNLLLVDGYNLAWRCMHQARTGDSQFDDRSNDSANEILYGFINTLGSLTSPKKLGPHNIVVALDSGSNWRHAIDPNYKEGRTSRVNTASRFGAQMARLPQQLALLGVNTMHVDGLEGDDILALLSRRPEWADKTKVLFTKDRDMLGFVNERTYCSHPNVKALITPKTFESATTELFKIKTGIRPNELPLFRALTGDDIDNVGGVTGCKEGYAVKIIEDLRQQGVTFEGTAEKPESLREKLAQAAPKVNPQLRQFFTPKAIDEAVRCFSIVQPFQAPQELKSAVMDAPVTFKNKPSKAQLVDLFRNQFRFEQFAKYVEQGSAWGLGLAQPPTMDLAI